MALSFGQVTSGSPASFLCTVPPGVASVTIANGTTVPVFITSKSGTASAATNGFQVSGNVQFDTYPGSRGQDLWVFSAAAATVSYLISTAE
jgi:hypothetical protein